MAHRSSAEQQLTDEVIERLRRRDPDAVEAVYRALSTPLYAYLLRHTRNGASAQDLVADVFVEVIEDAARFDGTPQAFRAWVFRIARNTMLDHFRKESRRRHTPLETASEAGWLPEAPANPEAEAMSRMERDRILAAVSDLPSEQKDVVLLRLVADLAIADVAEILGKSSGAVKQLQHRALRTLATRLDPGTLDGSGPHDP